MKYIELKDGVSVNKEMIESIKVDLDENGLPIGSIVQTESGDVISTVFPYRQLLQLIELEDEAKYGKVLEGQFHNG